MKRISLSEHLIEVMHIGFLDEAGDVNPFSGSRFLVVAVLVVSRPRSIELHVKRAHQRLRRKPKAGEMKASTSEEPVIERLLRSLADEEIAIVAAVVDKQGIVRPPRDVEEIYRVAVGQAVRHCVKHWPRITLYLDKRYTNRALRYRLEERIREELVGTPQEIVLIRQEDSRTHKALQAVDYVAWALFQKYERRDDRFYQIIADKIVVEEVVCRSLW